MTIRDQIPKGIRFAKLPVGAILDARLSDSDVRVLAYLLSRTSGWKVFVRQVANELKVSARTVRRSIVRLQEAGYAWRRVEKNGGLVRYPDIVISAMPRVVSEGSLDCGQFCPDERTPLSMNPDKSVHETVDKVDRLTQSEFFTQSDTTQTENTQSFEVSDDSAGVERMCLKEIELGSHPSTIDLSALLRGVEGEDQRTDADRKYDAAIVQLGRSLRGAGYQGGITDPETGEVLPF